MSERTYTTTNSYRYGFNGKDKDDEVNGVNNSYDFGARMYDPRIGRWLSVDKRFRDYVPISSFAFAMNNTIYFIDKDGNVIYGTDGEKVTISKDNAGNFIINGKPDEHTTQILTSMLKTPKGSENAIDLTTMKEEVRLRVVDHVFNGFAEVHGETYEADEDNKKLDNDSEKGFHHFNIDISSADLKEDRMHGWALGKMLGIIAAHERGHIKRGMVFDPDHKKPDTFSNELQVAFQYNILFEGNTAKTEKWVNNYNKKLTNEFVNEQYTKAVAGLIEAGKVTKEAGAIMVKEFIDANQPKKEK